MAFRPISRAKFFDFENLKTKGWDLRKFTDPQGWSDFLSKALNIKVTITQESLSKALNIPNKGNQLYNSWFDSVKVTRDQLVLEFVKPEHDFNSTNLKDIPKIFHNMIRHTILHRCGSFEAVTDIDLCIIYHLINKIPLNLCYIMIQYMIDQCYSIKHKVAGLPYGMHLTPIFRAAKINLDKEKGQATFMRFTAKTISQLRLTATNMPISQKTGSLKSKKKQEVEIVKKPLTDLKKNAGEGSHKTNSRPTNEVFALVAERARELIDDSTQEFEAMMTRKAVKNVEETAGVQNVDETLDQGVETPSEDIRFEENIEAQAQKVDDEAREVAEILVSNTLGSENQQMGVDEEAQMEHENVGGIVDFDLNVEDMTTDFDGENFQDAQEESEHIQEVNTLQETATLDQNVDQNVIEDVAQNVPTEPVEQLSVDPNPLVSRSLLYEEIQVLAQPGQNVQNDQNVQSAQNLDQCQFVNLSTSTMGSTAGISKFFVSSFPTPITIPSSTPPPPQIKTTQNLPNMSALFDSLNTFVTSNKEKTESSNKDKKPSKAEKMAARALRVSTKTHKIADVIAQWTRDVHAPGLAIAPPIFDDPTIFESEPSSDSGDSTP